MAQGTPGIVNRVSEYADVSAVTRTGENQWSADIDAGWTILGNPNGGYLQTVMARVAVEVASGQDAHPHVVAASSHFLRSPRPGAVELTAELLRAGRTTTQVRVRMSQQGGITGESLFTLGALGGRRSRLGHVRPSRPGRELRRVHAVRPAA